MKKNFYPTLIVFFLLTFLVGCSGGPKLKDNRTNAISPMAQSQEQKEILELLESDKQEIYLFEYETTDDYKGVEFWVEVYKDGELVDRPASIIQSRDEGSPLNGRVSVAITQNPKYSWTFIVKDAGAKSSHTGESSISIDDEFSRGFGPITDSVEIADGKEIVLYTSFFSYDSIPTTYGDKQEYLNNPDYLKNLPYVHMIKCRFTK